MDQEFRFQTIVDPTGLENVRIFVEDTLKTLEIDSDRALGILVAVNELTTNVYEHGYSGQPGPLELVIGVCDSNLSIRLVDEAPPFDPAASPAVDIEQPLHERRRGGLGIHLADSYADDITYKQRSGGGNEVTFVIANIGFH